MNMPGKVGQGGFGGVQGLRINGQGQGMGAGPGDMQGLIQV